MNQHKLCKLCPRNCSVDRNAKKGFCGAPGAVILAKAMLHKWEEPCICSGNGSGALFFSGCQLKCVYCQNHKISANITGKPVSAHELLDLFFSLEEKGACNINLVSPTPYFDDLIPVLEKAKAIGLKIPFVLNSSGYESVNVLKRLDGLVDIYLPDFKFSSSVLSQKYAKAKDYKEKCILAIKEMHRQTQNPVFENGLLKKGVIIRHLILPGFSQDSIEVLNHIRELFKEDEVILSLLRQYVPCHRAKEFPEIDRTLTTLEYQKVLKHAESLGFAFLYTQKKESAKEDFIPDFSQFEGEKN